MLLHRTSVDPQGNRGEGRGGEGKERGRKPQLGGSLLGGTGLWSTLPNPTN